MRRLLIGAVVAALGATAVAAVLAVGAIGGSGGGAETAAEGIQVHGDWTIEVRDPDGRVAERREFENALVQGGQFHLSGLLARTRTQGKWAVVFLSDVLSNSPCTTSGGDVKGRCLVAEPGAVLPEEIDSDTLAVSHADINALVGRDAVVLEGSLHAERDGNILIVRTEMELLGGAFTGRVLDAPVSVVEGQEILVRVEISVS